MTKMMRSLFLTCALIALTLMAATSEGCAWWQTTGKKIAGDALDCGTQSLATEAARLAPKILQVLTGGKVDWEKTGEQELDNLKSAGLDVFGCALQAANRDLDEQAAPAPGLQAPSPEALQKKAAAREGVKRARAYALKHRIAIVGGL